MRNGFDMFTTYGPILWLLRTMLERHWSDVFQKGAGLGPGSHRWNPRSHMAQAIYS